MAQYGEGYGRQTDEYGNPIRRGDEYGTPGGYGAGQFGETGAHKTDHYGTTGAYGTTGHHGTTGEYGGHTGKVDTHTPGVVGGEEGGRHRRSGSHSSSSSEDDGQGGRRKKKGVMGKIKDMLPGHKAGEGQEQVEKK